MVKELAQVGKFMSLMGQEMYLVPTIPTDSTINLRFTLTESENIELRDAAKEKDLVGIADGLIDKLYVLAGDFHAYGFGDINLVNELFNEVQRSNMTKLCYTPNQIADSISSLKHQFPGETFTFQVCNNFNREVAVETSNFKAYIIRDSDKKVMKPLGYSPPNLKSILDKYFNK